jgi:SAM-dependent methyltransferase
MGFYRDSIVPHLVNWTCASSGLRPWRANICAGLTGAVVEIGFGSGTNVEHYPDSVQRVFAVEPAAVSRRLARKRVRRSPIPVTYSDLDGHALSLPDESCDSALCTFTLCTVEVPIQVLNEIRRVLKPGGRLHFLEHGISPDASTAKWQQRLDGLEQRLAGGCHLIRNPLALVSEAGFDLVWSEQRYARGPRPWSYFSVGVGAKPAFDRD